MPYGISIEKRIPIEELPAVLSGRSKEFRYPWLNARFIQKRGMQVATGVSVEAVEKEKNPIYSGILKYTCPEKIRIMVNFLIYINCFHN